MTGCCEPQDGLSVGKIPMVGIFELLAPKVVNHLGSGLHSFPRENKNNSRGNGSAASTGIFSNISFWLQPNKNLGTIQLMPSLIHPGNCRNPIRNGGEAGLPLCSATLFRHTESFSSCRLDRQVCRVPLEGLTWKSKYDHHHVHHHVHHVHHHHHHHHHHQSLFLFLPAQFPSCYHKWEV